MQVRVQDELRLPPPVGEDSPGPLNSGLLASGTLGTLGTIIREIQARVAGR